MTSLYKKPASIKLKFKRNRAGSYSEVYNSYFKKVIGWLWVESGKKMWKQDQFEDGGHNPASIAIGGSEYLLKFLLIDKV